ncbi:unnamed protein product [Phaedon cochleariae]|uniref:DNA ligase n=1 Tax=Phaedon cochleariae TaxID=80249 RepID=A0A9P0DMB8_PHACE|nr:unnamed protein product [Phaedon cochleariae]
MIGMLNILSKSLNYTLQCIPSSYFAGCIRYNVGHQIFCGHKHTKKTVTIISSKNVSHEMETKKPISEDCAGTRSTNRNAKKENQESPPDSPTKVKRKSGKRARVLSSDDSEEEIPVKIDQDEEKVDTIEKASRKFVPKKQRSSEDKLLADTMQKKSEVKESKKLEKETNTSITKEPEKNIFGIQKADKSMNSDNYKPNSPKYHPINDAIWKHQDKVPYNALATTFEEIENISARLKIIEILSNYFRSVIVLTPNDLLPSVYLCLNKLAPAYEGLELGIADMSLMKAIAQSTGRTLAQVRSDNHEIGDLGLVAEKSKTNQRMLMKPARLSVRGVFEKLKDIAKMSGQASQAKKVEKIQSMFVACQGSEARFLIRSLAGKLRIGLAEQSVLQALALACTMTPPNQEYPPKVLNVSKSLSADSFKSEYDNCSLLLKTAYCECPNYEKIIPVILTEGVAKLPEHCKLTPGVPLKPMLAHPTKGVQEVLHRFDGLKFTCEWKYDGERAQIHIDGDNVHIFSRNQENNTTKYPDVISRLNRCKVDDVKSCILDCEAVAWDKENKQILPFQILSTRKRKDAKEADIKVQVCIFMFDLLYLNGEPLVKRPFLDRRKLLKSFFKEIEGEWAFAKSMDTTTMEEVQEYLEESVKGNCEGLMVKTLETDATYEIAKRSHNWLKLKKDYLEGVGDTLDVVVIGGYIGKGRRTGTYGGFLLACYDKDNEEYQSICKIGTGFSDDNLQTHTEFLKKHIISSPKKYYRYDSSLEPDHWFDAVQVWEIKCADLSLSPVHRASLGIVDPEKGISLRFPRFVRVRDDKSVEEATTSQQIAYMYSNQEQVKNSNQNNKVDQEDFY